jgi:hypothetical protein
MIEPKTIGGGAHKGQLDLEENDYKHAEDPKVDIQ